MKHNERIRKLCDFFAGFGYIMTNSYHDRPILDPKNCSTGIIFSPSVRAENYQSYRGYIHDTDDIAYIRINIPGIKYGLGQEPFALDLNSKECIEQASKICEKIEISKIAAEEMHKLQNKVSQMQKTEEIITCTTCNGTGEYQYTQKHNFSCKVCFGKGQRRKVILIGYEKV